MATTRITTTIYTGSWINWSYGPVLGSTITLSARDAAVLTSFIATFITVVGSQLWKIVCFILHQGRASREPRDGLYHQHQNLFRNSDTPGAAAWSFTMQSWHWRGRAPNCLLRSLPWASISVVYVVVFLILSIFGSSEVVRSAGQDRLIRGSQCGYWVADTSQAGMGAYEAKMLSDSQSAAAYAQECYGASVDALRCTIHTTPSIKWEGKKAECPFKDGICFRDNTYQMDTGLVDSHHDLGINMPQKERLRYRKVTTCSVLNEKGDIRSDDDTSVVTWNYGPVAGLNFTFLYNKAAAVSQIGYTVNAFFANVGGNSPWKPAAALNRTDADVHLVSIVQNSVTYSTTNEDAVFSAHRRRNDSIVDSLGRDVDYYLGDFYMGVIGCATQHQVCYGDTCTELASKAEVFSSPQGLSMAQTGIFERISFADTFTGIAQVINGRSGTALRASETLVGTNQGSLPPNQWEIEASSWFSTGLVMLQDILREYASPADVRPDSRILEPQSETDRAMCHSQKTKETNGTTSFSVLGLAIIIVVGTLLLLMSWILETVAGWVGLESRLSWMLDDKLHLQRMAFEARGIKWTNLEGEVPVTASWERFPNLAASAERDALTAVQDEEAAGGR